MFMQRTNKIS